MAVLKHHHTWRTSRKADLLPPSHHALHAWATSSACCTRAEQHQAPLIAHARKRIIPHQAAQDGLPVGPSASGSGSDPTTPNAAQPATQPAATAYIQHTDRSEATPASVKSPASASAAAAAAAAGAPPAATALQPGADGSAAKATSPSGSLKPAAGGSSRWKSFLKLVDSQCIPVALITMMLVGLAKPAWGVAAANAGVTKGVTITIFIIAGLQLRRGEAFTALKAWGCVLFGLASILLFTPLISPLILALPVAESLKPLMLGSAVFFSMPTTLSSGISMTTAAGGNTALAILLTVASNLLSVATLPLILPHLLGPSVGSVLQPAVLLRQLCENVLLPIMLGAALRASIPAVARWVDSNKRAVVWASAACLGLVPWMQVSKSAAAGMHLPLSTLLLAAAVGTFGHVLLLVFNWISVNALRLGGDRPYERAQLRQALVLQASQKTLPVAVAVLAEGQLAAQLGPLGSGLAAISAVAAHLTQVLVDSLLVGQWTAYVQRAAKQQ